MEHKGPLDPLCYTAILSQGLSLINDAERLASEAISKDPLTNVRQGEFWGVIGLGGRSLSLVPWKT
jgi:hypothetical protein